MSVSSLKTAQTENTSFGNLTINVTSSLGSLPINNATISISITGEPNSVIETLTTNSSGQSQTIELPAPALEYSTTPDNEIRAKGKP